MAIYTSNQWRIQVSVDGLGLDTVSWDKASGGDIVADNQTYAPGGMQPSITTGGLRKRNPITVERVWSDSLISKFIALDNAAGITAGTISLTPIKSDRRTNASSPVVYTGVLQTVTRPNADSSASNLENLVLIFTLNETVTGG
jgi:hypothetical protein